MFLYKGPGLLILSILFLQKLNHVSAVDSSLAPYCAAVCAQIFTGFSFSDCQSSTTTSSSGYSRSGSSSNSSGATGHAYLRNVPRATNQGHGKDTSCYCKSQMLAESYALCIAYHCLQDDPDALWNDYSIEYCTASGNSNSSSSTEVEVAGLSYTEAVNIASNRIVPFADVSTSKTVDHPINITTGEFEPYYKTYDTSKYEHNLGTTHGYVLIGYLTGFMILATATRLFTYILQNWRSSHKAVTRRPGFLERRWQQSVLYPSLIPLSSAQRPYTLPVRSHSLIVGGYVLLALALSISSYAGRLFDDNTGYPNDKSAQLVKYLADRTGMMAVSQLPFLFLFAGRNNIMLWLTGWTFKTFNLYHKWVGRVMWVLALVHTVAYALSYLWNGRYSSQVTQKFFIYGIVALTASGIIMVQASRLLRNKAYETFLVLHIILAVLFTVGVWYHLTAKHNLMWMPYIYCSIALWSFDRGVRLLRVAYFNIGFKTTSTAEVTVVEDARQEDSILLINIHTPRTAAPKPGQYLFVHFRNVYPWQAHPFTIMDHDVTSGTIRLAAKVHDGLTRALYNHVTKHAATKLYEKGHNITSERKLRVAIDGFYGHTASIAVYDTVLLIAGGAGITAVYPYVRYLLEYDNAQTRHIRLVWIVRHDTHLEILRLQLEELYDRIREHWALDIELYATATQKTITPIDLAERSKSDTDYTQHFREISKGPDSSEISSQTEDNDCVSPSSHRVNPDSDEKKTAGSIVPLDSRRSRIVVQHIRPQVPAIISQTVADAPASVGILACGPESLMAAVRGAVCQNIDAAKGRVAYFEEAFEW